ncbi:MAG: hypothetical protein R3F56_02150 [Planctomycetota bacterium]
MALACTAALALVGCRAPRIDGAGDRTPFVWLLGEWYGTRRHSETGALAPIHVEVRPILGGRGQTEDLQMGDGTGLAYASTTRVPGSLPTRWIALQVDDRHVGHVVADGVVTGTTSTWTQRDPSQGSLVVTVIERLGPDAWRRTLHESNDGGDTWRTLWVDDVHR